LETLVREPEFQELSEVTRIRILLDKATRYERILVEVKEIIDGDKPEQMRFRAGGTLCTFVCTTSDKTSRKTSSEAPHNAGTQLTCSNCAVHMTKLIADKLVDFTM
jgi:hypothetical protein